MRRAHKIWIADFWINLPEGRTRIREESPVNTKQGAEAHERLRREELANRPAPLQAQPKKEVTLKQYSEEFLQNWAAIYNRPIEVTQKRRVLKRHLLPAMGDLRLAEIDARVLSAYSKLKLDEGLHPNTVNHHLACISKMLHVAADEWRLIDRAPRFKKLEIPPPEWDFFLPEESVRLLEAAKQCHHEDYTLILTVLRAGLRVTELLALRWDCIDLTAGTLRVRRSQSDGKGEQAPKTKRERMIELSPALIEALKKHRHLRGPYVFCRFGGNPLTRDMALGALWRACRKAGLRRASWRMLRHTFGSQMLIAGRSLQEVKELLGHTEMQTTLRYAHLAPTVRREGVTALDGLGAGTNTGAGAQNTSVRDRFVWAPVGHQHRSWGPRREKRCLIFGRKLWSYCLVRKKGVEPSRCYPQEPEGVQPAVNYCNFDGSLRQEASGSATELPHSGLRDHNSQDVIGDALANLQASWISGLTVAQLRLLLVDLLGRLLAE